MRNLTAKSWYSTSDVLEHAWNIYTVGIAYLTFKIKRSSLEIRGVDGSQITIIINKQGNVIKN